MIPTNQYWFDNGKTFIYPSKDFIYKSLLLNQPSLRFKPRDGAGLVYYDNKLHLLGGWNPGAFGGNDTCNEHWTSSDGGLTWTQIANAGWSRRHTFGYGVKDGKIWVWGGDYHTGSYQKDVWTYDTVNGWVQVSSNWGAGVGDRMIFSYCIHKGYLYVAGGQDVYSGSPNYFTDAWKSQDGITWTKAGDLPYTYFSAGTMVSDGINLYIIGGGTYNIGGAVPINTDIYKSTNNGATWTLCGTYPSFYTPAPPVSQTTSSWPNAIYYWGKIWMINGYSASDNNYGIWYSEDGCQTWIPFYDRPKNRHATATCTDGTNLYFVTGNLFNDVLRIKPVTITTSISNSYAIACSLRKINPSYNGNCIRVRRSSDNTEQDIGWGGINGDTLDASALLIFVGAGNGYITKWYDQSGNGKDFSQSTQAAQPRIVNAGVIETLNGNYAINVTSGSEYLTLASNYNLGKSYSVFATLKWGATDIEFLGYDTANDNYMIYQGGNNVFHKVGVNPTYSSGYDYGATDNTGQSILSIHRDNQIIQMYQNGKVITLNGDVSSLGQNFMLDQVPATPNEDFILNSTGGEGDALYRFRGYMQEIIIYNSNMLDSKKAIETNMNSYYGTY